MMTMMCINYEVYNPYALSRGCWSVKTGYRDQRHQRILPGDVICVTRKRIGDTTKDMRIEMRVNISKPGGDVRQEWRLS